MAGESDACLDCLVDAEVLSSIKYAQSYRGISVQIDELISLTTDKCEAIISDKTNSLINSVYLSNKIEDSGLDTFSETYELYKSQLKMMTPKNKVEKEVINMIKVYDELSRNNSIALTKELILSCHVKLFHDVMDFPSEYRTSNVATTRTDGRTHYYPNHQSISKLESEQQSIYTIALSAYAQFHFVDIHPFLDGNGRMCRLISHIILSKKLSLSVPMFNNKSEYFDALQRGREIHPEECSIFLFELIIKEILAVYKNHTKKHLKTITNIYAIDRQELVKNLQLNGITDDLNDYLDSFCNLKEEESILLNDVKITRLKLYMDS